MSRRRSAGAVSAILATVHALRRVWSPDLNPSTSISIPYQTPPLKRNLLLPVPSFILSGAQSWKSERQHSAIMERCVLWKVPGYERRLSVELWDLRGIGIALRFT